MGSKIVYVIEAVGEIRLLRAHLGRVNAVL